MRAWVPYILAAGILAGHIIGHGWDYHYIPLAALHGNQAIANFNPDPNPQVNPGHAKEKK